ncbi:MAG: hypothetical protein LBB57_00235 [Clostridiales Family XIII bacterium]|jgi:beta-lactam-binding protein with PASTA domain|nr:hypothetical protein [Clostridiales Family XIII bacterium]
MNGTHTEIPDVLLLDAEEAARLLTGAGFAFRVVETRAPRAALPAGRLRVIRVRADGASDGPELTVCAI